MIHRIQQQQVHKCFLQHQFYNKGLRQMIHKDTTAASPQMLPPAPVL